MPHVGRYIYTKKKRKKKDAHRLIRNKSKQKTIQSSFQTKGQDTSCGDRLLLSAMFDVCVFQVSVYGGNMVKTVFIHRSAHTFDIHMRNGICVFHRHKKHTHTRNYVACE